MTITTTKLMELRKQAGEVRDNILQAKATMVEVKNNITNLTSELNDLGIKDIQEVDSEIKNMEDEVQKLYSEASEKIAKWI